ncbi:MAG: 16S rRNA (adenine(1518)-N(6)/adenine(1519)-N(6)) -dimethyltransferase RsmA [Dehalococcoidia bacterium]
MSRRPKRRSPAPRKALGQHFLRDDLVLERIAGAVHVPPGGVLVEVGAGTGQLTEHLLRLGVPLVALEIEPRLVRYLQRRFHGTPTLRIVEADARDVPIDALVPAPAPYAVVGNLPYFAASPIVRHFLEAERQPRELVVMVQREVAREIAAPAGKLSLLGIGIQVYAQPEILFDVPPEAFDPPPAVVSTVIRLTVRDRPLVPRSRIAPFFALVAGTFRNPRKQLRNALAVPGHPGVDLVSLLHDAGIDPTRRPETLGIDEWLALLDACEALPVYG